GAKGLQWPLVIVARLPRGGSKSRGGAPPTLITNGGRLALRVPKGPWMGQVAKLTAASDAIQTDESVRLAYVACTRPQHELWIAASAANPDEPLSLLLACLGKSYPLETIVGSDFEAAPPQRFVERQGALNPGTWKLRQRPISVSPSQIGKGQSDRVLRSDDEHSLYAQIAERSSQSSTAPVNIYATALGEVVHLALEHFDFSLAFAPQVGIMVARAIEQMKEQLPDEHTAELLVEAQQILASFAKSPLAAELGTVDVLAKELPFSCPTHWLDADSEAQIGTGFIDLLYRRADGTVVVADWKVTGNTDTEALKQRYTRQLQAYAEVVRPLVPGSRVEAELILVRSAERIAIEL
ncbi:MAG: PD-(D/E)XK nuclease family protein, partial [Myxococcota bacterium]|nr:PD-(D/E)XK nuclease family protein [Myxococcota bacterium]